MFLWVVYPLTLLFFPWYTARYFILCVDALSVSLFLGELESGYISLLSNFMLFLSFMHYSPRS